MAEETVEAPVRNYAYLEEADTPLAEVEIVPEVKSEPIEPVKEVKEEVKAEEPKKEEPKVEVKDEPKQEVKTEVKEKPAEVTTVDWKSALKTADKWEALKELGYDDFTIGMLKYKEQTGDYTPYLQVKTVDYTKMTPEQILKTDLRKQYPDMSEKALNFKYNKEATEKYYLNREDYPEGSDEAEIGQELMKIDAEQKRKAFIEEQNKFKAPEPQPDLDATKREADLQQQQAALGNLVMNNEATTSLQKSKSIVFGQGEESFTYPIADPQSLVDTAMNTILNSGRTDLTGVDLNLFYKQLAKGQPGWDKAYADHITALAKANFQKEIGNITPVGSGEPVTPPAVEKDYGYKTR